MRKDFSVLEGNQLMIDRGMLEYVLGRVRPQLQADGGDAEITDVDDDKGIVYVALQGACVDCPMAAVTLSQGIEKVLVDHVPGVLRVLPDMENTIFSEPQESFAGASEVQRAGDFTASDEAPTKDDIDAGTKDDVDAGTKDPE
jgi:Fe-S cluster biogenesis protein NfuA